MTQLKYFQTISGSPATVAVVNSGTSTVTVNGTVPIGIGMSVVNNAAGINTVINSVVTPNQSFVVNNVTGITTSTQLTIGNWVSAVVGSQGPQGTPGSPGGAQGPQGPQGGMTVGGTTTLSGGSNAYVTNSGTPGASILYFGIPQGYQGANGAAGATGSQGQTGSQGPQGTQGVVSGTNPPLDPTVLWLNPNALATNYTGPQGATGSQGATGPQGAQGSPGGSLPSISFTITAGQTIPFTTGSGNRQLITQWNTPQTSSNINSPSYNSSTGAITINQTGYYSCNISLYCNSTSNNNFFSIGFYASNISSSYYITSVAVASGQNAWAGGAVTLLLTSGNIIYPFYTFTNSSSGSAGNTGGYLGYLNIATCSLTYVSAS